VQEKVDIGPLRSRSLMAFVSVIGWIVLQNSKMTVRENFAIRPSKWIFGDTAPCNDLTKAAGWKSDYSCDPLHTFRANAPVPLEKIWTHPKKSFATQSGEHRSRALLVGAAESDPERSSQRLSICAAIDA
jgi:hypothetical protein